MTINNMTEDTWMKIKIFLHLPFPLKNYYYKWHRILDKPV